MEESKLTKKINDNPNKYIYIGVITFTVGIALNMFTSAIIKPALIESLDKTGTIIGYILNASTAFMTIMGLIIFSNSMTAKKERNVKKIVKRNKKRK